MPRTGRRAARQVVASDNSQSDSDSEVQFTQSQPSTSQNKTKKSQKTPEESQTPANLHEYVAKTIKIVLNHAVTKLPMKQADLTKQAMNGEHRLTGRVIAKAKELLNTVYELDLVELKTSKTKQYICVATHPSLTSEEYTEKQHQEMGLLFVILEYIYMKNGEVTDTALYEYLSKFEIYLDQEHEVFGDVKQLILTIFSKQQYLSFHKHVSEGSTVEKVTVKWGERAIYEFMKREMLDFVATSLNCNPSVFLAQYEEAYGTELDAEELGEEVESLQMSSQPTQKSKRQSRTRQRRTQQMEVDSDSD